MIAIGEASRQSGVSIETIRYYEREGITAKPERAVNGRRLYRDTDVAELTFIKRCRDLGFSLPDVRTLRSLPGTGGGACGEASALGQRHLSDVRRKIADLKNIEAALEHMIATCAEGDAECAMLPALLNVGD